MSTTRRTTLAGAAALVAATVARRARAADAPPIRIGVVSPLTGAAAESGGLMRNGIKLALDEVNAAGGVLGRPLETVVADDATTNPGAVLAFSRLASDSSMVAFIGSIRSTQVMAMAPDALRMGKPMMIGGTDPSLTHMGNRWLFRCRPNDSYSARVMTEFGLKDLSKQKWAMVYSTDAFGTNGSKAFAASLDKAGLKPALLQGYTNQQADYTPVVLAIRQSGADILGSYFTYETDLGVFARQLRQLGVRIPWVGSASITANSALNLGGPALYGSYGVTDFAADANPASKAFAAQFQKQFSRPADNQSSWAYDAVHILAKGIAAAGSTDPEKIRAGIIGIQGYQGVEGVYDFDANGDGLHGYSVTEDKAGKIDFSRYIAFKD